VIALLTITPIGQGKSLKYFYEYKADNAGEIGWADDGREVSVLTNRFQLLSKENKVEMIVKTLPIQKKEVTVEVVPGETLECDPVTGEIVE
jgi:hypothetical protein